MKNILLFIFCLLLSISFSVFYTKTNEIKIGYVDAAKLFDGYKMTSELQRDMVKVETDRKNKLDTLAEKLNRFEMNLIKASEDEIIYLKKDYLTKSERYTKELEQLKASYQNKIWKQLNQYAVDFGKEKNYQMILGANGQGNIMYATEISDLTAQLLEYSNNKYDGTGNK
ncbi:MAG: OmpH family outer membrane protein [Bacteroidota bacterium]